MSETENVKIPGPRPGQRIRWTGKHGTVVEGVCTHEGVNGWITVGDDVDIIPRAGTLEILPDPEPTVPGTVVRDANGGLWATDGQAPLKWHLLTRPNGGLPLFGVWADVPKPVEVLFVPEAQS